MPDLLFNKRQSMFRNLFLTCSLVLISFISMAQQLIGYGKNAASFGMGDIVGSYTDVRGILANPSSIATLPNIQSFVFIDQRFGLKELSSYSAAIAIPLSSGSFGLSLNRFGYNLYNENLISLSYARQLFTNLSIGGSVEYNYFSIPEYGSKGQIGFQLGINSTISSSTTLYFSIKNPNRPLINETDRLPSFFNLGATYSPSKQLVLRAELNKTLDFKEDIRFGVEYFPSPKVVIRAGGHTYPAQFSFGFGILPYESIVIEASSKYDTRLGFLPGIGLSYGLSFPK